MWVLSFHCDFAFVARKLLRIRSKCAITKSAMNAQAAQKVPPSARETALDWLVKQLRYARSRGFAPDVVIELAQEEKRVQARLDALRARREAEPDATSGVPGDFAHSPAA
jgi:hypothetical protein